MSAARFLLWFFLFFLIDFPVYAKPIELGIIFNLKGDQAILDESALNGAKLAIKQINAAGGVLSRPIHLLFQDGKGNLVNIKNIAKQFSLNPNLVAGIGLNDSDYLVPVMQIFEKAKIPFIAVGATDNTLLNHYPRYLFLTAYSDEEQAEAAAIFARKQLKAEKTIVFYDPNMRYTKNIAKTYSNIFQKNGGKVLAMIATDQPFEKLIKDNLSLVKSAQVIYLASNPDNAIKQISFLHKQGIDQPCFGGDSFDSDAMLKALAKDHYPFYFTTHVLLTKEINHPAIQHFNQQYYQEYGHEPENAFAALAYDSIFILATAIKTANSTNREKVINSLMNTSYHGITGYIKYSPKVHYPVAKKVWIIKVVNGKKQAM